MGAHEEDVLEKQPQAGQVPEFGEPHLYQNQSQKHGSENHHGGKTGQVEKPKLQM
jgi:hypothetical protein